ncbi:enoyl-CoA hydratase-related protein [Alkanindiges sp. WGS2144]|uniref:enoyl-CoA hydratase-related protein n=1 Tax=Alkanindiges sp. WGS2144 TaxID=3366808 RepID=UPI003750CC19
MSLACLVSPHQHLNITLHDNGILELVLNRPERKNALFGDFYLALTQALNEADLSDAVRVVLLRGEKDFCAGNDLQDFIDHPPTTPDAPAFLLLRAAASLTKPLVVAVQGVAIGIGSTILLHADLVYSDSHARFQLPFLNLGLVPEGGSTLLLPQRAGYLKAAELLLLGEPFNAQTALLAGLVTQVIEEQDTYQYAHAKAAQVARLPLATVKLTKQLLRGGNSDVIARINEEGTHFIERAQSKALHEAVAAFKEKRMPDFKQFED